METENNEGDISFTEEITDAVEQRMLNDGFSQQGIDAVRLELKNQPVRIPMVINFDGKPIVTGSAWVGESGVEAYPDLMSAAVIRDLVQAGAITRIEWHFKIDEKALKNAVTRRKAELKQLEEGPGSLAQPLLLTEEEEDELGR